EAHRLPAGHRALRRGAGEYQVIEAADLTFAYRGAAPGAPPVVDGVSMRVERAASVALLGPNGAGKTTLLKLLAGMLPPRAGQVTLDGRPVSGLTRRDIARRLAVVPQETRTPFDFTVIEMVLM